MQGEGYRHFRDLLGDQYQLPQLLGCWEEGSYSNHPLHERGTATWYPCPRMRTRNYHLLFEASCCFEGKHGGNLAHKSNNSLVFGTSSVH